MADLDGAGLHGIDDLQARTISPAANTWIWNLSSVASATALAHDVGAAVDVSSDFGQLHGIRHLISGIDCAIAGAATAVDAARPRRLPSEIDDASFQCPPLVLYGGSPNPACGTTTSRGLAINHDGARSLTPVCTG